MTIRWPALRSVFDLAASEARHLFCGTVLPLVLLGQVVVRLGSYVAPRLMTADEHAHRILEQEGVVAGLTVATLGIWLVRRLVERGAMVGRLRAQPRSVFADVLALGSAVGAGLGLHVIFSLDRIPGSPLAAWGRSLLATAPFAALAPGLVRLPGSLPAVVAVVLVVFAGGLGFLGPWFPLRADTVLAGAVTAERAAADALSAVACILFSLGITLRR